MNTLNYKGYTAKIEFDPEDNILFGNIIGIRDTVGFHGESVGELKAAFHEAVDFYLESCEKAGREPNKPFSGKSDFSGDPFPSLRESWLVDLDCSTVTYRTYADSLNPPILHRKELLLQPDDPRREACAELTSTAESIGMFDDPRRIGYPMPLT